MLAAGNHHHVDAAPAGAVPGRARRRFDGALSAMTGRARRVFGWIARGCALVLSPLVRVTQAVNRWADRKYPPAITWALDRPGQVIGGAVALFVLTLVLIVPRLGTELIPQMSQGEFNVDLRLPAGHAARGRQTAPSSPRSSRATGLGNVDLAYSVAGTGNRLDANPVDAGENTGRLSITLVRGSGRAEEEAAMAGMRRSLESLPGVQYQFSRPSLFALSTPLEVVVSGYDLDRLRDAAEQVRLRMQDDGRFADVKSTVEAGNPEIQIVFDQERATQLGLVVRDIADRVVNSVRGEVATRYTLVDKKIDVLVRSVDTRAASIEEVRNLIVNPGSDFPVPLSAVADVKLAIGPAEVRRIGQERVAVVSANLAQGDLGAAVDALEGIVADVQVPVGTTAFLSGQSEDMSDSLPLAAVRAAARDLPGLPRDGVAVRVADPPVRDPAHHPARDHRRGLGAVDHRYDGQRRGVHRAHHAGRHRRQPVDRADRRGQPGARARPRRSAMRSSRPGGCACARS